MIWFERKRKEREGGKKRIIFLKCHTYPYVNIKYSKENKKYFIRNKVTPEILYLNLKYWISNLFRHLYFKLYTVLSFFEFPFNYVKRRLYGRYKADVTITGLT